ncbi:MAG: portal protein [Pseudomonadales bacterium]|nr:portal protein [Pseudomonadales bacterium]
MANVDKIFELYDRIEGEKTTIIALWREIGEFMYPGQQDFYRYFASRANENRRRRPIFDPTGEYSLGTFASSTIGLVANQATKFISFQPTNVELLEDREVQLFMDEAQRKVLAVFNNPRTRFYTNLYTVAKLTGAFGTGMLMMDIDEDNVIRFRSESPKNYNYTEDFTGSVDEVFFEREYTVAMLKSKAETDDWEIPGDILSRNDDDKVRIVRHILRNPDFDPNAEFATVKTAKYHSNYYLKEEKTLIRQGFHNERPVAVSHWDRIENEKWPDSPGRVALGNVKMMQAADRAMIVAMEKELKPTLFLSSEAKFGKLDTSAGAVNVGRGNPNDSVREMRTNGAGVTNAFAWMETKRQQIRTAFYVDVFQTAMDINMTATEAAIRNQERLRSVAPKMAKFQADIIGPAAEMVLIELIRRGELIVPRALAEDPGELRVSYMNPLAQAQRLEDANNILQYFQDLAAVGQVYPEVFDRVDPDSVATEMAEIRGVPERIMRPKQTSGEDVGYQDIREQRAQAQQQQQALQATQQVAEVAGAVQDIQG